MSIKVHFTLALDTWFRISLVEEDSVFSLSTLSGLEQKYPPPFFLQKKHTIVIFTLIFMCMKYFCIGYTLCQWCEELMEQLFKIQYLVLLMAKNIVLFWNAKDMI